MWQRTQLGFESACNQPISMVPAPISHSYVQNHQTQLQFNLNHAPNPRNMATTFRTPAPLVIEKLPIGQPVAQQPPFLGRRGEAFSQLLQTSAVTGHSFTSLSNERLSFAVELAKRDLKNEKRMLHQQVLRWEEEGEREVQNGGGRISKERAVNKTYKKTSARNEPNVRGRIGLRENNGKENYDRNGKQPEPHYYPASSATRIPKQDIPTEDKQAHEIRRLRRKIVQYAKRLEEVRTQGPEMLRKKDKRIVRKKDTERLSDEESDPRQMRRAEEQAARSSRMLYMLQRQVQDIQDELNKKGRNVKHTKKSQTLNRLAAAHRGAVRALQMFINHAPLQPKLSHGLPPMYQELALLIRQLSLLTTELDIEPQDLPEDVLSEVLPEGSLFPSSVQASPVSKKKERENNPVQVAFAKDKVEATQKIQQKEVKPPANTALSDRGFTPKPYIPERQQGDTPDLTPERNAILRAGLEALLRVKETPAQNVKETAQAKQKSVVVPSKKAVLLPSKLKAKRQRAQTAAARTRWAGEHVHFAQDTLAFQMKRAQGQKTRVEVSEREEENKKKPAWTPPGTPKKSPSGSPGVSPRQSLHSPRSRRPERELVSSSGRKSPQQKMYLPYDPEMTEREVARQNWLDKEADRQVHDLRASRYANEQQRLRNMSELREQLISEAESEIRRKIQPLLDQAKVLAESDKKSQSKHSLSQNLGEMVSEQTMEQADLLADLLLEDVLGDTAEEFERLDANSRADSFVDQQDSSTLENLWNRLQDFEREEEEIRRHWTRVSYADTDSKTGDTGTHSAPMNTISRPKEPRPMYFNSAQVDQANFLPGMNRIFEMDASDDSSVDDNSQTSQNLGKVTKIAKPPQPSSVTQQPHHSILKHAVHTSQQSSSSSAPYYMSKHSAWSPSGHTHPKPVPPSPSIPVFVPSELRASIAANKNRYEQYLKRSSTLTHGTFDPWKLVESLSDEIMEEVLQEVVDELEDVCENYTETLFSDEFKQVGSHD